MLAVRLLDHADEIEFAIVVVVDDVQLIDDERIAAEGLLEGEIDAQAVGGGSGNCDGEEQQDADEKKSVHK